MKRFKVFSIMIICWMSISAQVNFDMGDAKMIASLIMNKEHNKADSTINSLRLYSHTQEISFFLDLMKCWNGYVKIKTYKDPSVIVPYSEYGKRAFLFTKDHIKEYNNSINFWPYLSMWAEIFNYLDDSIVIDISAWSYIYYTQYKMCDLNYFYNIQKNAYQYCLSSSKWEMAAKIMKELYNVAEISNDTTILKPTSAVAIGNAYFYNRDYKNAEEWYVKSYDIFNSDGKTKSQPYCQLLDYLAKTYYFCDNYTKALSYASESCTVNRLVYGEYSSEYVNAIVLLSDVEFGLGRFEDAISHSEEAINMFDYVAGIDESIKKSVRFRQNWANLYLGKDTNFGVGKNRHFGEDTFLDAYKKMQVGDNEAALFLYYKLICTFGDEMKGYDVALYCMAVSELSGILVDDGKYSEADSLLNHSISILHHNNSKSLIGIEAIYVAKGKMFYSIFDYDKAIYWLNLAIDIYREERRKSVGYAKIVGSLATCLAKKEKFSQAKEHAEDSYRIITEVLGKYGSEHDDVLLALNNLGSIYIGLNDYAKSKEIFETIIRVIDTPKNEQTKALALFNLAVVYLCEYDYSKAEYYLSQAKQLRRTFSIDKDIDLCQILIKCIKNEKKNALSLSNQLSTELKKNISDVFGKFSESEREDYWAEYSRYLNYCNNLAATTFNCRQSNTEAFNNILFTKRMLLGSEQMLDSIVNKSDNLDLKKHYSRIKLLKKNLSDKRVLKDSISICKDEINRLEKRIITTISSFSNKLFSQFKTMDDVKNMLSDNEIAVEFTLFPHIVFPTKETTNYIGAFILSKEDEFPKLVELCTETELKQLTDSEKTTKQDEIERLYNISDTRLYQLIWSKIEPLLPKGSIVYYSPSSYINRINLSAVSDGKRRLSEYYELHEVSITSNIDRVKNVDHKANDAVLYGDINYFEDIDLMSNNSANYGNYSSGDKLLTRSLIRGSWDLLPGTKEEIVSIRNLMIKNGIKLHLYNNNSANEESFKELSGKAPDIIHISTHAYYLSSDAPKSVNYFCDLNTYTKKDLSMSHSGLLFAGANNAWVGKEIPDGVEDGILTADEVSRIDLSNNKLIVLSACDTALGDINNVDGVLGLQRGLKKAGANTILMSLWKIPDSETTKLMYLFYTNLLSGKTPYNSLKYAQKEMSNSGFSPYYWASFVLLD